MVYTARSREQFSSKFAVISIKNSNFAPHKPNWIDETIKNHQKYYQS